MASALLFGGGIAAPWLHIPQAEEIPVLGTVVDLFAVVVLIGLIASSIRRYVLKPPGLQRTTDATIVVSLIALLMVTYLLAEAGGRVEQAMAREAGAPQHGWGQTWLPAGRATAQGLAAVGLPGDTIVHLGVAAWWIHAFILLFFLVYLPYSKHMHLIWAPVAVFFSEMPHKGMLPPGEEKTGEAEGGAEPNPLASFTWRMLLNGYACAECGRCERVCPVATSGAKLSPRQVVHDVKELVLHEGVAALAGRPSNGQRQEFIGGTIVPEAIWGCATCHACVDKCPVRNEHVALIVEMRRKLVEQGRLDGTLQETLLSLQRVRQLPEQVAAKAIRVGQGPPHGTQGCPQGSGGEPVVPRRLRGLPPLVHAGVAPPGLRLPGGGTGFRNPRRRRAVGRQRRPPAGRRRPF